MSFEVRKAQRQGARLLIQLSGVSGSGKTYTALQLAYGLAGNDATKSFSSTLRTDVAHCTQTHCHNRSTSSTSIHHSVQIATLQQSKLRAMLALK